MDDGVLRDALTRARGADGGFGPRPGAASEPEPTALAAIALADEDAATWLSTHQSEDGSVGMHLGPVSNDSPTPLAAFVLSGDRQRLALSHVKQTQGRRTASDPIVPRDPSFRGWAWTEGTAGWVEPTARALLALRAFDPSAPEIADAVGYLRDRACVGGGWNYGNRSVYGEDLPPYLETTAAAMLSLRPDDGPVFDSGLGALRRLWPKEAEGGLSLAMTLAAARTVEDPMEVPVERAMFALFDRTGFLGDTVALAWAAIATGEGLATFRPGTL